MGNANTRGVSRRRRRRSVLVYNFPPRPVKGLELGTTCKGGWRSSSAKSRAQYLKYGSLALPQQNDIMLLLRPKWLLRLSEDRDALLCLHTLLLLLLPILQAEAERSYRKSLMWTDGAAAADEDENPSVRKELSAATAF